VTLTTSEGRHVAARAPDRSFDCFYRSEYAAVVRLAYTLTGRRDLAEELAQDAFLAAHRNWTKVSGYDDPPAWVRRVVANRSTSSGRRHLTGLRLLARLSHERPAEPELSEPTHELWAMVRALPKRQAQVLALTFLEDRSVADVAAVLGCGEETVRTHLRRGRQALAGQLRPEPITTDEPTDDPVENGA
jgi:RNA polymerase sigma-70 factor (ECF subfamily)